jgi:Ca-activated chloride channel family protein
MKKYLLVISCLLPLSLVIRPGEVAAQSTRSSVNKGVDLYHEGKYIDSEVEFKKGLEKSPNNFQAHFNLGDSFYKEGKYEDALKAYNEALSKAGTNDLKAKVYHNMGNALLKDQKLKESVGAYINSLKINPNDESTKYNLSYALDLLKNQKQQNKNDQNKDNKQNKNDQNKDQNKNNQNQQNNRQNKNDQKNQQQNQMAQQPPPKISKDQAEAIFNALNNDEKDLQKQLRKMKGQPVKTDKDW